MAPCQLLSAPLCRCCCLDLCDCSLWELLISIPDSAASKACSVVRLFGRPSSLRSDRPGYPAPADLSGCCAAILILVLPVSLQSASLQLGKGRQLLSIPDYAALKACLSCLILCIVSLMVLIRFFVHMARKNHVLKIAVTLTGCPIFLSVSQLRSKPIHLRANHLHIVRSNRRRMHLHPK